MKRLLKWVPALLLAAWLVNADSHTDDAGIVVGLVFLFSAAFAVVSPRHPWRWGLFWGLCIPVCEGALISTGHLSGSLKQAMQSLITLFPAFAGAYSGAFVRREFKKDDGTPRFDP